MSASMNFCTYKCSRLWMSTCMNVHLYECPPYERLPLWISVSTNVHLYECQPLWMSASMNVCLYECLPLQMTTSTNVCPWEYLPKWMFAYTNVCLYECLPIWISAYMNVLLYIYPPIRMSAYTNDCLTLCKGCLTFWIDGDLIAPCLEETKISKNKWIFELGGPKGLGTVVEHSTLNRKVDGSNPTSNKNG